MVQDRLMNKMAGIVRVLAEETEKYNQGYPEMEDAQWDFLYNQLVELEQCLNVVLPMSPTNRIHDFSVSELQEVTHNHLMLSLAKTKDKDEVESFIGDKPAVCMCKMDGLTCSLNYQEGILVRAETRGNGEIGEDVTHNIRTIANIPQVLPVRWCGSVDGEIITTYDNFNRKNEVEEIYKHPRNYAAGSIRSLSSEECAKRGLSFIAWDMFSSPEYDFEDTMTDKLIKLENLGFDVTPAYVIKENGNYNFAFIAQMLHDVADSMSYPIDGIVIKYDNVEYYNSLGHTNHHFRGGLAFKFYDEIYTTNLLGIRWSVGRTGVLTPVAQFKTVEMDGTHVSQASLHNYSVMTAILGQPYFGQEIQVYKANQIIPQVLKAAEPNEESRFIPLITHCPVCGERLTLKSFNGSEVENLVCENIDCIGQLLNKIVHFCGEDGLNIKMLSEKTIEALMEADYITTYADIFELYKYEEDIADLPRFGKKRTRKLIESIQKVQQKVELWRFISALGLPKIGRVNARMLAKYYGTWDSFEKTRKKGYLHIKGVGRELNTILMEEKNFRQVHDILPHLTIVNSLFTKDAKLNIDLPSKLADKRVAVTGKIRGYTRKEFQEFIESQGGKVTSAVSTVTDVLLCNDQSTSTAKVRKARDLNIPILTQNEFTNLYLSTVVKKG